MCLIGGGVSLKVGFEDTLSQNILGKLAILGCP